jgi:STE24 endopeptidase
MGVFGPLRYILLTDGLVERMDDREVEAVMAHELGHVRRHHMPWMAICAIGLLGAMFLGVERGAAMVDQHLGWEGVHAAVLSVGLSGPSAPTRAAAGGVLLLAFVLWGAAFGYISRRFERQADTFAVQHLATQHLDDECGQTNDRDVPRIDARAVADMAGALETVCRLNRSSTARPSWRHGSVDWRVGYLHSLVGRRIDDCPIDRHIRRLRLTGAALLLATVATELLG